MRTNLYITGLRQWPTALVTVALLWLSASLGVASGDIVYSARYYALPGSRNFTHFHLYRINPDGSDRRQTMFGDHDDYSPSWSPGGREIRFVRASGQSSSAITCDESGRHLRATPAMHDVQWSPDGRYAIRNDPYGTTCVVFNRAGKRFASIGHVDDIVFSPDSRHAYVRAFGDSYVVDIARHTWTKASLDLDEGFPNDVAWLNDREFACLKSKPNRSSVDIVVVDVTGRMVRRKACSWNGSNVDPGMDTIDAGGRGLASDPVGEPYVDYIQDVGTSGDRPDNEYHRCSTVTGAMLAVCDGQFLVWSPDRAFFCSATEREMVPYDRTRYLWATQLYVGRIGSSCRRKIVSGMVWVTGADWRNPPR